MPELWDILDAEGRPTGRVSRRGDPLAPGDYHLVVQVWIRQPDGRFVISLRAPEKPWGLWWECTGGSAVAGDDSLATALKEVREELGIVLEPARGRLLYRDRFESEASWITDCWLFDQEIDPSAIVCQPGEVIDARLATVEEIGKMVDEESFVPYHFLGRPPWNLVRADGKDFYLLPAPTRHPGPA